MLRAAVSVARAGQRGLFAGAWVLDEWVRTARPEVPWKPGLRTLATYELIEKVRESTRGGKRAYYRMPIEPG